MRAKDYIEASYALLAKGESVDIVLQNLHALLAKKGLLKLYPRILRGIIEILNRKSATASAQVVVARESDIERNKEAILSALATLGTEGAHTTRIDPAIVGGFIATGKGRRVDRSFKSTLLQAYHKVVE